MNTLQDRVIAFVSDFTGVATDDITVDTTVFGDLRVDGLDGDELVVKFSEEFSVDISDARLDRHFGPEGLSVFAPLCMIWYLVSLPFRKKRVPEIEGNLIPIHVSDLVTSARDHRWSIVYPEAEQSAAANP